MTDIQSIGEDLRFVRNAVAKRQRNDRAWGRILIVWAVYVVIGYTLIDFAPLAADRFFAIGGIVGGILSWLIGRHYSLRNGELDRTNAVRSILHFFGGIMLACAATIGLTIVLHLSGNTPGQVFVVMIGLVYYLWGVHYQRYFAFLGPIVMAGGVLVGLVPHFGWTLLGLVIAAGLLIPALVGGSKERPTPADAPQKDG